MMDSPLVITVNGVPHEVETPPDTPLLMVLRNELGLNAARYGCGFARCGACAVHVDHDVALSCVIPVGEMAGRRIVTLEGLGGEGLHPLQQAFLDEQAAQCGYCAPGIIMTAAAFLERDPHPADDELRGALDGTLCRCGAHPRVLKAIRRVIDGGDAVEVE
jgi:nicotinate dehydrogenase subunit A